MSILNEIPQSRISETQRKAARVRFLTKALADEMLRSWNEGWDLIWTDPNPQDVLDALGNDGAEVFELSEQLVLFFSNILSGRKQGSLDSILAKVASKPETQTDEDGNVTII